MQTHRADAPFPRHLHSHYLHDLHNGRGAPGLECASGGFRSVHQDPGKVIVLEFTIWCPLEAGERPLADIGLGLFLQLRRDAREHLNGDSVPGLAGEALLEHGLHPLLVRLRERRVPPVEQVEFDGVAVALPPLDEGVVGFADKVEWVERPSIEVGDEAEDGSDIVAKDGRGKVSAIDHTCHVEDVVVLLEFLLRCEGIPIFCVARVDPSLAFVDLENFLAIHFLTQCKSVEEGNATDAI